MAVDARTVATLAEEEELAAAMQSVLDAADDDRLTWADVESELTSGQWGRLIQHDVVTPEDGDQFAVTDRAAIEKGLSGDAEPLEDGLKDTDDPDTDDDDTEETTQDIDQLMDDVPEVDADSSWSQRDKFAALASAGLIVGYWFDSVQDAIGGVLDIFLGPIHDVLPFWGVIFLLAMLTGTYATLLMSNLMDMDVMGEYQDRMKAIQEKQKEVKETGDDELQEEFQKKQMEMMGDQLGMFKSQFRPMVWIMLLTIPIFLWLWWQASNHVSTEGMIMPIIGDVEWGQGIGGPFRSWIIWYMVVTISFRQLISKALHIQTTPTGS